MILFALQNKKSKIEQNNLTIIKVIKKLKINLLVCLSVLLLISCTKEYYTEEYYTIEEYNGTWVFSKEYTIGDNNKYTWHYDSPGIYYCEIPINELTQQIYEEGILGVYYVHKINNKWVDSPLPFDEFYMEDNYQWTYQYSCEFSPGLVTIIFKDSSFFEDNPPTCTFVVKMMR